MLSSLDARFFQYTIHVPSLGKICRRVSKVKFFNPLIGIKTRVAYTVVWLVWPVRTYEEGQRLRGLEQTSLFFPLKMFVSIAQVIRSA